MLTFFTFLILNILFKIVVNDVLNNLSMMAGPIKKEIIEYVNFLYFSHFKYFV